jgi:hypothetical protein
MHRPPKSPRISHGRPGAGPQLLYYLGGRRNQKFTFADDVSVPIEIRLWRADICRRLEGALHLDLRWVDYDSAAERDGNVVGFRVSADSIAMVKDGAGIGRQQFTQGAFLSLGHSLQGPSEPDVRSFRHTKSPLALSPAVVDEDRR